MALIHVGDNGRTWLVCDNVMSETFNHPAQVSNHPMGRRSTPADHRLTEPMTVDLVLRVTETPFSTAVPATATAGGVNPLVFNDIEGERVANGNLPLVFGDLTRPRSATFAQALKLYEEGLFEYLSASMGLKTNLVIVNWSYEIRTPLHVDFNISLQEVEFIEAQRVELPPLVVIKKAPETCPTVPTGDKAKTAIESSTANPRDYTILQGLVESAAGGQDNVPAFLQSFNVSDALDAFSPF